MRIARYLLCSLLCVALLASCKRARKESGAGAPSKTSAPSRAKDQIDPARLEDFKPLPRVFASAKNPITAAKTKLGQLLYHDKRLSRNHDISCDSCHALTAHGVDNKPTSPGHRGQLGARNSPTVYNAAGHFVQFWDGRAPDVEEQAKGPILNPVEMAMPSEAAVVKLLKSIPGYVKAFEAAFPQDKDPVTYDNLAKAIGAFERTLLTPGSWDRFLAGEKDALNRKEKIGFNAFVAAGCPTCHTGTLVGGHIFQKLGLVKPWPGVKDPGRYEATQRESDRLVFKVPSLRNIAKTGPYLHDGSIADLKQLTSLMASHQLGRTLKQAEATAVVTWLHTLTGDPPTEALREPTLPPSGPKTPKPDPS